MMRNSISGKFLCVVLVSMFLLWLAEPLNAKGFSYKSSVLTDEDYSVCLSKTDKNLISCAAVNRKSKPPIFLDKTFLGSGSIGFIDVYFSVKASSRVVSVPVSIGDKNMTVQAVAAGHIISLGFSELEISNIIKKGMSINGQKLDSKNLSKLYSLVSKCLANKK